MLEQEDKDLGVSGVTGDFCTCGFCELVRPNSQGQKTAQKTNNA
ncbi:hypothetical protein M5D96_004219 [Drosophila gunungcola]|uniref:Uncharacterized protein n=1 Tax=Drosophila gunungcola TaxID=103775 RepID=A0A9P9YTP3_9MUSC|nr:hypothetical protein M5D96_004219 [Drosophila gunungcola]